jgi:hypothetical protein
MVLDEGNRRAKIERSRNGFHMENSCCVLSDSEAEEEIMKAFRIPQITELVGECRKQVQETRQYELGQDSREDFKISAKEGIIVIRL